jgi:hypothetical protein
MEVLKQPTLSSLSSGVCLHMGTELQSCNARTLETEMSKPKEGKKMTSGERTKVDTRQQTTFTK